MQKFCGVLALVLTVASSSAFAGGAISSGGGSFRDQHNPWFLKNVSTVHYCISLDTATFSASLDEARADLQKAIAYWQQQFTALQAFDTSSAVQIAQQSFVEVDCPALVPGVPTDPAEGDPNVDIHFILGYGGLYPDQLNFFTDPTDPTVSVTGYIGVTVRTSYDDANMRGKGYVYISSDMGSHVYVNDGNLISPAWTKPNLLLYALIHETGHVFGFPHTGSSIMSEVFLEQTLDQHLTDIFQNSPIESFLFPGPTIDNCANGGFSPPLIGEAQWFGMPAGDNCLKLQMKDLTEIDVSAYSNQAGNVTPPVPVGSFKGIDVSSLSDMRSEPGIFIHLVPGQTLFSEQEAGFRGFLLGPSFIDFGAQANYIPANGSPLQSAYLRITSNSFMVLGNQPSTSKLGVVYSYESPIDILVTQPPAGGSGANSDVRIKK